MFSNGPSYWMDGVGDLESNPFAIELRFLPFDEQKFGKEIHVITCIKGDKYYFYPEWMAEPTK